MTDPYRYFRIEARELIEQLGRGVLDLEKEPGSEPVQRVLRHAHTLKGAARVVKQAEIADRAHAIESVLAPYREAPSAIAREDITRLLAFVDDITQRVAALGGPTPVAEVRTAAPEPIPVLHADHAELDELLDGVVEMHARLAAVRLGGDGLARARRLADVMIAQLARSPDKAHGLAHELRDAIAAGARTVETSVDGAVRELGQLREHAENLRLVPAESIMPTLERTARDAAAEVGKQVDFTTHVTGNVRLDGQLLATIQRALVQLVRNAVAHGIETPRERTAAGKPPAGRIAIEVVRRGRRVVFACRDDGRGIDLDAIRMIARERGLQRVDELGRDELVALVLRGGISTAPRVTEVAGRGIGLDVVREAMARFGGDITVHTDGGTAFELVVPASLTAVEALVVEAGGCTALIPLDAIRATRRLAGADISRTAHDESIIHDGIATAYRHLADLLGGPSGDGARAIGVLVRGADGEVAIGVDRLHGTTSALVRPIPESAGADPLIAGAALDTLGTPRLVLDPDHLVAAARRARTVERQARVRHPVLVIDDSLTTRMLEQSILETAGYDVDTAVSAEDGLAAARRKRYALFLVDVEMPGMDGFTFIERIRADATLRDIPAILVTSRASAEDRARGDTVGAQGYIVKSEFDQADLLARIERMVG